MPITTQPPVSDRAFDEKGETMELVGPYFFIQKKKGHRYTQDSALLAEFILPVNEDDQVIDLGTGTGIIPHLLALKSGVKNVVGVEVDTESAGIARRNVGSNSLQSRIKIVESDYRDLKSLYPEGSFNVVVSNPPYIKAASGRMSPLKERALARSELKGTLPDLLSVSRHLAGPKGRVCYVFPVKRLSEMLIGMKKAGLTPRRLRFVHTGPQRGAKLFLIEASGSGQLKVEEPLFL